MRVRIGLGFLKSRLAFLSSFLSRRRNSRGGEDQHWEANEEDEMQAREEKRSGLVVEKDVEDDTILHDFSVLVKIKEKEGGCQLRSCG